MAKASFDTRLRDRKESVGGHFDKALDIFIADRKRAGCTERTIEWYENILGKYFRRYLEEKRVVMEPAKWISSDIEDYMDYLVQERGCKLATCKNRFTAIRAWCNFLFKKGYLESNPVAKLAPMKVKKEISKTLPDDSLDKVTQKPDTKECMFAEFRDWAIKWTLFDTGIRVNEFGSYPNL